jgi:hypothetical protein
MISKLIPHLMDCGQLCLKIQIALDFKLKARIRRGPSHGKILCIDNESVELKLMEHIGFYEFFNVTDSLLNISIH